jgi:dynein heavy chain, axonemal
MKQLYGFADEVSHEWTDGVLAVKFRQFAKAEDPNRKWLLFDGPVDAIWIENMNTVLDDNKKLCLNSGEIIAMSKSMNLIFEPMDLQAASPATVSRNGMVYMEPSTLGWRVLLDSWAALLPSTFTDDDKTYVHNSILWVTDHLLEFIRNNIEESSPTQDQNLLQSLMKLFRSLLKEFDDEEHAKFYADSKTRTAIIDAKFVFSLVWSFGASADTEGRKKIEHEIKKVLSGAVAIEGFEKKKVSFPDRSSLFDYNYIPKRGSPAGSGYEWVLWTDYIDLNEKIPKSAIPQ